MERAAREPEPPASRRLPSDRFARDLEPPSGTSLRRNVVPDSRCFVEILVCSWIRGALFDYRRPGPEFYPNGSLKMTIELDTLKNERDKLRESLREVEAEVRKAEAELKGLRQREIQTKREIEALSTLIDIKEQRDAKPADGS
jgi:hypothetical protein